MTVLRLVSEIVTTPLRPTSLPVPAVVGMAIIGGIGWVIFASPPIASSYSASGRLWLTRSRTSFATSRGAPPPSPTTTSAFASA